MADEVGALMDLFNTNYGVGGGGGGVNYLIMIVVIICITSKKNGAE